MVNKLKLRYTDVIETGGGGVERGAGETYPPSNIAPLVTYCLLFRTTGDRPGFILRASQAPV